MLTPEQVREIREAELERIRGVAMESVEDPDTVVIEALTALIERLKA